MSIERVTIGNNIVLIHGNCSEILPTLSGDLSVVTDPPYGIAYRRGAGGRAVAGRTSLRHTPQGVIGDDRPFDPSILEPFAFRFMWGANHYAAKLPEGRWYGWDKTGGGRGPKDSFADIEFAWSSTKGSAKIFHYLWKGVCQDGEKGERRHHPTQKPIKLMEWCIGFAPPETTILDPYMGAGSTGIAAVRLGRPFVGIEVDRTHFEKAVERITAEAERRAA